MLPGATGGGVLSLQVHFEAHLYRVARKMGTWGSAEVYIYIYIYIYMCGVSARHQPSETRTGIEYAHDKH